MVCAIVAEIIMRTLAIIASKLTFVPVDAVRTCAYGRAWQGHVLYASDCKPAAAAKECHGTTSATAKPRVNRSERNLCIADWQSDLHWDL